MPKGHYELKLIGETIEHSVHILAAPAGPIDIAQAGQQVKGIEFVIEAVETAPEIEHLPPTCILIKSTSDER